MHENVWKNKANNIDYTKEKEERGIFMDYKKLNSKELAEAYLKASNFTKKRILRSGIKQLNGRIIRLSISRISWNTSI